MHPEPDSPNAAAVQSPEVNAQHPWLGLLPYREEHREFFFGRDREVEDVLGRIRDNSLTVVYGQSGFGKSSIIAAGVVPKLREAGYAPLIIRLAYSAADTLLGQTRAALSASLQLPESASPALTLWELLHPRGVAQVCIPVLIFDQFEEIFTLGAAPEFEQQAADWWEQMADLLQNRPPRHLAERLAQDRSLAEEFHFDDAPLRIVFALREDYLAQLEGQKARLPLLMQNRMALAPLNGPQARQAVLGPAQLGEDSLVSREVAESIVRRAADVPADTPLAQIKAVPPFLSLLCEQLNAARLNAGSAQISAQMVQEQSADILQRFYKDIFLSLPEQHRPAVRTFLEDALLTETEPAYRNTVIAAEASRLLRGAGVAEPAAIFDILIQRRLITAETRDNVQRLEIAHDVLIPLLQRSRTERRDSEAKKEAERKRAEVAAKAQMESQQKALLMSQMVETLQQRKARRRDLKLGAAVIVVILALLAWALKEQQTARREQQIARQAEAELEILKNHQGKTHSSYELTLKECIAILSTADSMDDLQIQKDKVSTILDEAEKNKDEKLRLTVVQITRIKSWVPATGQDTDRLGIPTAHSKEKAPTIGDGLSQLRQQQAGQNARKAIDELDDKPAAKEPAPPR